MPEDIAQPVFLDTTVLSNFASSCTVGYLVELLTRPVIVPAVRKELERGRHHGYDFLDDAVEYTGDDIPVLGHADHGDVPTSEIRDHLDAGEAESLLAAIEHDGTLATDDLAARRLASDRRVPVTGSVGLLVLGIRRDTIDADTANEWLSNWKRKRGYFAPVDRIEDIL